MKLIDHRRQDCRGINCPDHAPRPPWGVLTEGRYAGSGYCDACSLMGAPNDASWLDLHLASEGHKELNRG